MTLELKMNGTIIQTNTPLEDPKIIYTGEPNPELAWYSLDDGVMIKLNSFGEPYKKEKLCE
ncbi:TPA: hypothetical protein HA241_01970 [Candidatus Woesearchaeota archaeon]|nr:hypothetical protein [Candidatus Woesearchaeota archaeon]